MAYFDEIFGYVTVAASQTTAKLGVQANTGDWLQSLVVVPNSSTAQSVVLKDGTSTIITIPTQSGGTGTPQPYALYLGMRSKKAGGWSITTGTSVSVLAIGHFT